MNSQAAAAKDEKEITKNKLDDLLVAERDVANLVPFDRQQQGQASKESRQQRDDPLLSERRVHLFRQRPKVEREIGIHPLW